MKFINTLFRDEAGATAIEYGLIAALIAVAAIVSMGARRPAFRYFLDGEHRTRNRQRCCGLIFGFHPNGSGGRETCRPFRMR